MVEAVVNLEHLCPKHPQCHPTYRKKVITCHRAGMEKGGVCKPEAGRKMFAIPDLTC